MKIPLFDIDGTVFKTANPLHREAFKHAFKEVFGVDADQNEIEPEGMLDNKIIIDILNLHGIPEEEVKKKLQEATSSMKDYFRKHLDEANFEILPGVKEIIQKLKENKIPIGILSGNVEGIAWAKIEKGGLKEYFDFGAFGNEAFRRVDLIEIARKKAEKILNKNLKTNDFIIVGDTPKDIQCAKDGGIKVIAVATGIYSLDDLRKEKPDLLIETLMEKDKILNFLND